MVGNSSAADIALVDGAIVRNAKVDCQQLQMVKRHFMQERRFLIEAEVDADTFWPIPVHDAIVADLLYSIHHCAASA